MAQVQDRDNLDLEAGFETREGKKRAVEKDYVIDVNKRQVSDQVNTSEPKFTE